MGKYDDIIRLPHHRSEKHPPMPEGDRAAQFMPFAALTGYGDAIAESERLTEAWREPTEEEKLEIGRQLQRLAGSDREAEIVRFVPDPKKDGGRYETLLCRIRRIETPEGVLITDAGDRVAVSTVVSAEPV